MALAIHPIVLWRRQLLSRVVAIGVGCAGVMGLGGCQTLYQPVTEPVIDQELITQPAPNPQPTEPVSPEPRPGFEQEPSASHTP